MDGDRLGVGVERPGPAGRSRRERWVRRVEGCGVGGRRGVAVWWGSLLVPQSLDGIHSGCPLGRPQAKKHPYQPAEDEGDHHGIR